ncbi:MAG: alpha/beta hydrolase [Armatimonadetes bacterium]|nr:alpha/beta hydrolase [Armatimonadota bacterium]
MTPSPSDNPHQGQPVLTAGEAPERARAAMVLIHGRGASAEDILSLTDEFDGKGFAYFAPQAAGSVWYPGSFMAPASQNEPWLSSALDAVGSLLARIGQAGIPQERAVLLGFSQGACLALEHAARYPGRYGGVVALSGALIENGDAPRDYRGSLEGSPVFLGCSDIDFFIPQERVLRSSRIMRELRADVTERIYPRMGHTVNQDEIAFVRGLMAAVAAG